MASTSIDESQSSYPMFVAIEYPVVFQMVQRVAKVAHRSSPYIGEANHTILEAIGIASFIILIMACIGTSLFVMVILFWAKRVACHSSLAILYNAMDGG
ncbi:hypothetical protein F383_21252 [Gossypium arboreum]|uniref:Uncharacterized protein n=1 Tax=Gossypium arboreum TaxID=29729 RepID=A0A0B0NT34_GOSAR|nr:hypothetical protein F383_21252 [Gossypium arboreum]